LPLRLPFEPPFSFDNGKIQTWANFEEHAFNVIGFTLELLWQSKVDMTEVRDAIVVHWSCFLDAFAVSRLPIEFRRDALQEPKTHYHPFVRLKSHKSACAGKLSVPFLNAVLHMREGEGVLFWCGGDAPVDYVLVIKYAQGKCRIQYADAKHKTNRNGAEKSLRVEAKAVYEKAQMVHAGLKRELQKEVTAGGANLVVDDKFSVSIVTNLRDTESRYENVIIIGPATFKFEPWTSLLYESSSIPEKDTS
jgi:hypothetical protein